MRKLVQLPHFLLVQTSPFFSLHMQHKQKQTRLVMQVFTREMHTGSMKKTVPMLRKHLPSILHSMCFNESNIPFRVEVLRTELGHLFEHILLEYLCQYKLAKGYEEASFQGTTDWNWNSDPRGTFHITISVGKEDLDIFPPALHKTQMLFEDILSAHCISLPSYRTLATFNSLETPQT